MGAPLYAIVYLGCKDRSIGLLWVGLREVLAGCGDDASLGAIFCIMSVLAAKLAGIGEWDYLATIHRYLVLLLTVSAALELIAVVLVAGVLVAVGVGVAFHVAEVAELTSIVIVLLITVIVSICSIF
jgi:hypothetical protein